MKRQQPRVGNYTDGVTYVELAPVSIEDTGKGISPLAAALADALNFSFHGSDTPDRQIFGFLLRKEMLLVLDNFEHLLDTAARHHRQAVFLFVSVRTVEEKEG